MIEDINGFIHRALKHLRIRDNFFGSFMCNFTYSLSDEIQKKVDYKITENGHIKCLINPNAELEEVIKELKHIAIHLIKEPIPKISPSTTFEKICGEYAYDAITEEGTLWHGLPTGKESDFYYKRLLNLDLEEDGFASLRKLDPQFCKEMDKIRQNPEEFEAKIDYHLYWLSVQTFCKYALDETLHILLNNYLKGIEQTTVKNCGVGAIPAYLSEFFIFKKEKPKFDWKRLIRRHLGTNPSEDRKSTRRKPSRRFEDGKGQVRDKNPSVLVLLDTSGSVGWKEFNEFFTEIDIMSKRGFDIDIAEFDGNLERISKYNRKNNKIDVQGRGGTNLSAACDFWNKHRKEYAAGVLFTDGYDNVSNCHPRGHFLWVISSTGYQEPVYPGGKQLFIPKTIE